MRVLFYSILVQIWCGLGPTGFAVTLLQRDDFDTGFESWGTGGANPNKPLIVSTGGSSGTTPDPYMRMRSNATSGAGGRLAVFNRDQWQGDYTSAGVTSVEMNLLNESAVSLSIRVAINGPGGWFVSPDVADLGGLASWERVGFSLRGGELVGDVGSTDVVATLANVTELRLIHNPNPEHRGVPILATLGVDGITAIPEPRTAWLAMLGGIIVSWRRRRS